MKIIKRGTPPEEHVYQDTCMTCKTKVEFVAREARFSSDQRDGDALIWTCPVCKKENWISASMYVKHPPMIAGDMLDRD